MIVSRSLLRLLLAAAALHLVSVITISFLGKQQILPHTFDQSGIGTTFAVDSTVYRYEAEAMAQLLQQGRLREWWNFGNRLRSSSHVRPYSISFALVGKLSGYGILAAEPINLCYYLAILVLTYAIGAAVFSQRVGLRAATIVGLWPSLLLYSTQVLRDSLVIGANLLFILGLLLCLKSARSFAQAGGAAGMVAASLLILWLVRADGWEPLWLVLAIATVTCVFSQLKDRRFEYGKTIAFIAILLFAYWLPHALPTFRLVDLIEHQAQLNQRSGEGAAAPFNTHPAETEASWHKPVGQLAGKIGFLRHRFIIRYPMAGSNIDTNVELSSIGDIVRYLPRAVEIGFLAPFPNMWFARGAQVGKSGRVLVGGEMLVMYLIIALMLLTLIHLWDNLMGWFLFASAAAGCIALSLVVVNMSSLYRMRYPFFILLIILGVQGWHIVRERFTSDRAAKAVARP